MKFDIVRAWKDENYRDNLSDADLEIVYGCGGGFSGGAPLGGLGSGAPVAVAPIAPASTGFGLGASDSYAEETRIHSYAVVCDLSVFSLVVNVIPVLNIASPTSQLCASDH